MARKSNKNTMMPRSRALVSFLEEDWTEFKKICNRRWDKIEKNLVEGSMSSRKVLGSGYFGVVLKTSHKKLVIKVTSDKDEGYFNSLILSDPVLASSKGLPLILDCFHIPEWSAHVILRENVHFGLENLPESSPLARTVPILDQFGEKAMRIEGNVADVLRSMQKLNRGFDREDFDHVYREAKGLIRQEIIKSLKKFPNTSANSKYYPAMQTLYYTLDKYGIALWDLHSQNLGRHKYDMSEFEEFAPVPELDKDCVVILDVGGNFGSPIMSDMVQSLRVSR